MQVFDTYVEYVRSCRLYGLTTVYPATYPATFAGFMGRIGNIRPHPAISGG